MNLLLKYLGSRNPEMLLMVKDIEAAVARLWKSPQTPWFTEHGVGHSYRIGSVIEQILFGVKGFLKTKPITSEEMLVLIGACLLHDVGMQMTRGIGIKRASNEAFFGQGFQESTYEVLIRPDHPHKAYSIILDPEMTYELGLDRCPAQLRRAIAEIVLSHGIYGYLPILKKISFENLRLDMLGALLQIGDALDISRARINPSLFQWINLPALSASHWVLCMLISSVVIDSDANVYITYEVPKSVYYDSILTHAIRHAVERTVIVQHAAEAVGYLRAKPYLLDLRFPVLDNTHLWKARDVMHIGSWDGRMPVIDMNLLNTYFGNFNIASITDKENVQSGCWPDSTFFKAIIRAIIENAHYLSKGPIETSLYDTDVGISHRCGLSIFSVRAACECLLKWNVIISGSKREPLYEDRSGPVISRYELNTDISSGNRCTKYWIELIEKEELK